MRWFFALFCALQAPLLAEIRTNIGLTIPQRGGGAAWTANLYAPQATGLYPVISMLPGGGAPLLRR